MAYPKRMLGSAGILGNKSQTRHSPPFMRLFLTASVGLVTHSGASNSIARVTSANFLAFEVGGISAKLHAPVIAACLQIPEFMTRVCVKWDSEGQIREALAKERISQCIRMEA
ncbi:hypothetical protein EDB83DRAFT_2317413 [Lactarius deliciosus]|nr:hypothetical protein EDB83DRAFT_2317413 [Lactarius deliciosus]